MLVGFGLLAPIVIKRSNLMRKYYKQPPPKEIENLYEEKSMYLNRNRKIVKLNSKQIAYRTIVWILKSQEE